MKRHFFLDKGNTIVNGSKVNTGLNPVLSICYGLNVSRGLIHFNINEILNWILDNSLDINKTRFTLHMTNYFSVDNLPYEKNLTTVPGNNAERACSFDLEFFDIPKEFDAGRGYDYHSDFWIEDKKSISEFGCNWYNATTAEKWDIPGVYGIDSMIIGRQHFDFGNENINLEITDYVIDKLYSSSGNTGSGACFYGIGIKFADGLEDLYLEKTQCVNFFTDNTNLYFHPYIEAEYLERVKDDRYCFNPNEVNNLYLFVNDGVNAYDLDELPQCSIGKVSHVRKGVYKTTIYPCDISSTNRHMEYDVWSNIKIESVPYDDVEQEFVIEPKSIFNIKDVSFQELPVPSVYGINDSEIVNRGEIRTVFVDMRQKYTTDKKVLDADIEYRIYVKDGGREFTIFDYDFLEQSKGNNFFILYTKDLIPNRYFVDIKVKRGMQERKFKDVLHFTIANELSPKYTE